MTVTWYYYPNEKTWNTSVNATNRLVSDQSGVLGVWPCHCSLSAVGKPSNPSDSHSLQACKQNSEAEKEVSTFEKKQYGFLLAEIGHEAAKSQKIRWRFILLIPTEVINLQRGVAISELKNGPTSGKSSSINGS